MNKAKYRFDGSEMNSKLLMGHPSGLFVLFFTEMWERFSYYGMRAILVLFLTSALIDGGGHGQGKMLWDCMEHTRC